MTMSILVIDLNSGLVWNGSAGHEPPYHLSRSNICTRPTSGVRLGVRPNPSGWSINTFQLQPGDSIISYTDGLIENTGPDGQTLPDRFLRKDLQEWYDHESKDLLSHIIEEGQRYWQEHPPADDCTVVVCRWLGPVSLTKGVRRSA